MDAEQNRRNYLYAEVNSQGIILKLLRVQVTSVFHLSNCVRQDAVQLEKDIHQQNKLGACTIKFRLLSI